MAPAAGFFQAPRLNCDDSAINRRKLAGSIECTVTAMPMTPAERLSAYPPQSCERGDLPRKRE
jgi:hypothetical protein